MPTIRFTNRLDRSVESVDGYVLHARDALWTHMAIFIADTPGTLWCGTLPEGLFYSENGGATFECASSHLPQVYAVQIA